MKSFWFISIGNRLLFLQFRIEFRVHNWEKSDHYGISRRRVVETTSAPIKGLMVAATVAFGGSFCIVLIFL